MKIERSRAYSWSDPKEKYRLTRSFSLNFRYIDDVLSLNNPNFGDLIHRFCPKELEIMDTADTVKTASYLDLHLEIDGKGKLLNKLYDSNLMSFHSELLTFLSSVATSLSEPAYGVFIRYARACRTYELFVSP